MQDSGGREQLRQVYQREDTSKKTFIPAKPKINPNERDRFFRVCAYCRVSTDNDEQLSSFELQQAHYRQLVQDHPNWELKHIFADQGISGTSLKNRDAFNEMIEACKHGEYDLIITKSVSRFARKLGGHCPGCGQGGRPCKAARCGMAQGMESCLLKSKKTK